MIEIILKPILKFAFGSAKRSKITIALIAVAAIGAAVWYVTDTYGDMKTRVAELEVYLEECKLTNTAQLKMIKSQEKEAERRQKEYIDALENRKKLDDQFTKLDEDRKNDLAVFNKECGRFQRLMEKRGSRVVSLANRATERMRERFERATNNSGDN